MCYTRIYNIYQKIKRRCYDQDDPKYYIYGGKGIIMCEEWLNDFINFYNWSIVNGYNDNLTIDRKNSNDNYCPENCRWVDIVTQNNNTSRNVFVEINGETKTLAQWANLYGLKYDLVWKRYQKGLIGEKLIEPPSIKKIHSHIIIEDAFGKHEFKSQTEAAKYLNLSLQTINNYLKDNYGKKRNDFKIYRKEKADESN